MRMDDADQMKALMVQVRSGDVQAFHRLYERFKGPLMSYAHSYLRDPELTEDVVQEVFLKVYRTRETYEPKASVSTWLWTIARNCCIDALRRASQREETQPAPEAGGLDFDKLEAP